MSTSPTDLSSEQKDDNNQPITSLVKNPKHYESAVCDELLEWDWKWMTSEKEIPHDFQVEPLKHTYSSLETYKNELKKILSMEILKKLCTKYNTIFAKDDVWNYMTVKDRKDGPNYHTKLDILCDFEEFKFGTLLLLKVMDMYHVSGKPTETSFFGYITSIDDKGDLKIDAYCTQLKRELSVLKYVTIMHIRSYIKLFAVLHCIQDTPLMKLFLNSNLNKIDRNEAMTSEMTAINLCPEQTKIVNKISYECTNDESEKIIFINGGAGTGKTYMMLATVINFKICLKDKRQYLICTSTSSELDEIVETLSNMPHSTSLNIVQFGYQEEITGRNRKYLFHELVQQKHNNSGKNYKEIQKEIILNADIILSTIKDCYELFDYQLSISACFIDNANFVVDTELMILLHLNIKKMIFIGDEYQLEPTHSHVYKETRCNNSYFNRIINYYKANNYVGAPVFTLLSQHRMNQDLFKLSNKHIYNNCMTCDSMSFTNYPFKSFSVFTLDINPNDQKLMDDEIDYFCEKLCEILPKNVSIGIVSGYKSQVDNLKVKLETVDKRIECLAVETIQGIEKDVIILTLRNTETNFMLGFNRINVAITRARKALYICSNMNMSFHPSEASVFLQLKDDARNRDLYQVIQKNDFDRLYSILRK